MKRSLPVIALLMITACSQQDSTVAPQSNQAVEEPAAPADAAQVPSLDGNWHITAIDGQAVGAASAMDASFAGGKVSIASGCLRRAWTYTQKRNVVAFASDPGGSANCGGQSPDATQETAYAALQASSIAIFNQDGSEANLSGTGGNLTLRRR